MMLTRNPDALKALSEMVGIPPIILTYWRLDPAIACGTVFLTSPLHSDGPAVCMYDGRVTGIDTGIAGLIDLNSGANDPTMSAVGA
jgi:hypothetical protein